MNNRDVSMCCIGDFAALPRPAFRRWTASGSVPVRELFTPQGRGIYPSPIKLDTGVCMACMRPSARAHRAQGEFFRFF